MGYACVIQDNKTQQECDKNDSSYACVVHMQLIMMKHNTSWKYNRNTKSS